MQNKGCSTVVCLGLFAQVFVAQPAAAQSVLFEGGRVIVGDGSPAIEDGVFLVVGGVITRVGRRPMLLLLQALPGLT
jgi:hypothetical protein